MWHSSRRNCILISFSYIQRDKCGVFFLYFKCCNAETYRTIAQNKRFVNIVELYHDIVKKQWWYYIFSIFDCVLFFSFYFLLKIFSVENVKCQRWKKERKGNEQQYLSEQKAKCIFIYNITMVNILETVLAKSKEQCVSSIKKPNSLRHD